MAFRIGRGLRSIAKLLVGLTLAPAAIGVLAAAVQALAALFEKPAHTQYFLIGCAAYPLAHFATTGLGLDAPRRLLYVLGHELTHAFAAWISGYSVKGFSIGAGGGHVDVSRSNAFIALAPYVFPFYSLAVIVAYRGWTWYAGSAPLAHEIFLLAFGLSLSFHWVFTASALWTVKQPDLAMAGGTVFSLVLIALGNGLVLLLALKCLFPKLVSLEKAGRLIYHFAFGFWVRAI